MADQKRSSLLGVQFLRGAAALMVAYFHLVEQIPEYASIYRRYLFGWDGLSCGVDIFFVISGFIISLSSSVASPGRFLVRRVIRVVPLYWFFTILLAAVILVVPGVFKSTVLTSDYFFKSLFFIPFFNSSHNNDLVPLLVPGWSLNFEMFFYLVFAGTLFLPSRFRLYLCGVAFALIVALGLFISIETALGFYSNYRILEFYMGMLIAHAYSSDRLPSLNLRSCWLVLGSGFAAMMMPTLSFIEAGGFIFEILFRVVPAAAVVLSVVALENLRQETYLKFPLLLGDASYSIYLSHIFSLGVARLIWDWVCTGVPSVFLAVAFGLLSMTLVIIVGIAVYRFIERPLLTYCQVLVSPKRTSLV
jgi:exopolysaccharide production protein ExoZ